MNRDITLSRIIGPSTYRPGKLQWKFIARRDINHRLKRVTGRKFILIYEPEKRAFTAQGFRRLSKRNKRQEVEVCRSMIAYLRSRLQPADIVRCTAASIANRPA